MRRCSSLLGSLPLVALCVFGCARHQGGTDPATEPDASGEPILETHEPPADQTAGPTPDAGFPALACPEAVGTPESLREKAEAMDALAQSLHIRPGQDLLWSVILHDDLATFDRVAISDNVGSWTAMYSASQSFRYAATRDPTALDNLRRVLRGQRDMLRITGVHGLFTRAIIDPSLPGFPSPAQLLASYPDCDLSKKHCKRYIEVTEGPFAGRWFKNDVSKDEYAAHMFAMAVAWELVDDSEVRDIVHEVVTAVGDHLIQHGLRIVDVDGVVTTYGHLFAQAFDDFPGFNAALSLAWVKLAAVVGGEPYASFYRDCLLQASGERACIPDESPAPYTTYLPLAGLNLDCKTNWNNHNMLQLAYWILTRFEQDPALRATYRAALRDHLWDADDPRPMRIQQNTLFTFFYLLNRDPADPWPGDSARDAVCTLKRYPARKNHFPVDTLSTLPVVCLDRSGDPMADVAHLIPIDQAVADNYQWGRNPWELEHDDGDARIVESPEDYLLAYWLGRWAGFLSPEM